MKLNRENRVTFAHPPALMTSLIPSQSPIDMGHHRPIAMSIFHCNQLEFSSTAAAAVVVVVDDDDM